jgi:hypothetical protein
MSADGLSFDEVVDCLDSRWRSPLPKLVSDALGEPLKYDLKKLMMEEA